MLSTLAALVLVKSVCTHANSAHLNQHAFPAFKDIFIKTSAFLYAQQATFQIVLLINVQFVAQFIKIVKCVYQLNARFAQLIIYCIVETAYQVAQLTTMNRISNAVNALRLVHNALLI
jgi:hypothetical protein